MGMTKTLKVGTPVKLTRRMGADVDGAPVFEAGTVGLIVGRYMEEDRVAEDMYTVVVEGAGGLLELVRDEEFTVEEQVKIVSVSPDDVRIGERMKVGYASRALFTVNFITHTQAVDTPESWMFSGITDDGSCVNRHASPKYKVLVEREV